MHISYKVCEFFFFFFFSTVNKETALLREISMKVQFLFLGGWVSSLLMGGRGPFEDAYKNRA